MHLILNQPGRFTTQIQFDRCRLLCRLLGFLKWTGKDGTADPRKSIIAPIYQTWPRRGRALAVALFVRRWDDVTRVVGKMYQS